MDPVEHSQALVTSGDVCFSEWASVCFSALSTHMALQPDAEAFALKLWPAKDAG